MEKPRPPRNWASFSLKSFVFAWQGFTLLMRSTPNARVHAGATVLATLLGLLLDISPGEWCILVLSISIVWAAETFNTALELLVDHVHPEWGPAAGQIKDLSAAAVLICSIGALLAGSIIFIPRLWILLPLPISG